MLVQWFIIRTVILACASDIFGEPVRDFGGSDFWAVSDAGEPTNSVIKPPETNGLTIAGFFGTLIVNFGGRVASLLTAGGTAEGGDFFGEAGIRSEEG